MKSAMGNVAATMQSENAQADICTVTYEVICGNVTQASSVA